MKTFKEQMAQDLTQIFINSREFADWHMLNDKQIECIVEENQISTPKYNRSTSFDDGIYESDIAIFYKFIDYPVALDTFSECYLDGVKYHVASYKHEGGLVKLGLNRV